MTTPEDAWHHHSSINTASAGEQRAPGEKAQCEPAFFLFFY